MDNMRLNLQQTRVMLLHPLHSLIYIRKCLLNNNNNASLQDFTVVTPIFPFREVTLNVHKTTHQCPVGYE